MAALTPKEISLKYFTLISGETHHYKFKCDSVITQGKNTGWSNLFSHGKSHHEEEYNKSSNQSEIHFSQVASSKITKKGKNVYLWINWICSSLKPFSFVDNELFREYSRLEPICSNSLKKYMELLTKKVEAKIKDYIPETIAILIDGWSKGSIHFVGLFASFTSDNANGYECVMLAFAQLLSETSFTARDHYEFVSWVLQGYGKNLDNVTAINTALFQYCG